jgi:hypothetical protein
MLTNTDLAPTLRVKIRDQGTKADFAGQAYKDHGLVAKFNSLVNELPSGMTPSAIRRHKSGDMDIYFPSHEARDMAARLRNSWLPHLGTTSDPASITEKTFPVRLDGVPTRAYDGSNGMQFKKVISDLKTFNAARLGFRGDITWIGWLGRKSFTLKRSSLIINFTDPHDADMAIDQELYWHGEPLKAVLYDASTRPAQCYRCQNYSHKGTQCGASPRCGYCAGPHTMDKCRAKKAEAIPTCALCEGTHRANSDECIVRKAAEEEAKALQSRLPKRYQSSPTKPLTDTAVRGSRAVYTPIPGPNFGPRTPTLPTAGTKARPRNGTSTRAGTGSKTKTGRIRGHQSLSRTATNNASRETQASQQDIPDTDMSPASGQEADSSNTDVPTTTNTNKRKRIPTQKSRECSNKRLQKFFDGSH